MNCNKCKSIRVLDMSAKCSDRFNCDLGTATHDGYVPLDMGIGGGDYIELSMCLDCGQVQGKFPLPETDLELKNLNCCNENI